MNLVIYGESLIDTYDKSIISDAIFFDFSKSIDGVPISFFCRM